MAITVAMRTEVSQLYVALFGRAPDGDGLGFWTQLRDQGQSLTQIANTMYATTPARTYFPSFMTNGEIIASFYVNVLGRTADAEGQAFWTAKLNAAGATPGSVIAEMINTVANYGGTDAAGLVSKNLYNNKVAVAQYYGEKNGNISGATTVLNGVTADAATVATAKTNIDNGSVGGVNQGVTTTLTANTDVVTGTNGNDTFIAGLVAGAATLTAGDSISGGSGTDRLNLFDNLNAAAFKTANVTGVEQVYAQIATNTALDVSGNAGVTEAWIANGSTGANTVGLAKTQKAGVQGTGTGVATFAFTSTGATNDTATLALDASTGSTGVTIAGIEAITIEAAGTSDIGTLTAAALATLNVSGSGKVTLATAGGAAFKTLNASTNTGGVVADISGAAASDLAVTGGTGADEVTINFANLTKLDVIDLGAGADILGFSTGNVTISAATAPQFAGTKGVEAYKFNGAITATVDADATDVAAFTLNTTGKAVFTELSNTDTVTFGAVAVDATSTYALKLGQNTFNVALAGSATAVSNALTQTLTGSSVVNVSSSGNAAQAANVLSITTPDNNTFNVTGAKDLTLTVTGAGGVTGQTVDASAFTGKLNVTSTALADIVKGGSGADTITAGAGVDTLTGGAGKDTFVMNTADAATTLGAVTDIITDFVTGTDMLKITTVGAAGSGTNFLKASAVAADLATLLTAADTALDGTVKAYLGQVGSDSYLVTDGNGTGYTEVIKLTGVALAGFVAADIIA